MNINNNNDNIIIQKNYLPPFETSKTTSYSVEEIDSLIEELKILSSLKENESVKQNYKSKKIIGIYPAPEKQCIYFVKPHEFLKAGKMKWNGDTPEDALSRINAICDEISKLIQSPYRSPYDFYCTHENRLETLKTLDKLIVNIKDNSLNHLTKTLSDDEQKNRKVKKTTNKIIDISKQILFETDKLEQVNESPEQNKEHLTSLLDSIINPNQPIDSNNLLINKHYNFNLEDVKDILYTTYGENVVNEMLDIYKLSEKHLINEVELSEEDDILDINAQACCLNSDEYHALIMGITANLTYPDVLEIIESKEGLMYEKIYNALGKIDTKELDESTLFDILCIMRDVDRGSETCIEGKPYKEQLSGDRSMIASCNVVSEYNFIKSNFYECEVQNLKKYGYMEHLARDYCYSLFETDIKTFRDGVVFPQYNKDGEKVCRQGFQVFNKDFIFALGVTPIEGLCHESDRNTVQIVFRGTYDLGSLYRDAEGYHKALADGPGKKSFEKHQDAILEAMENFLQKQEMQDIVLEISGHSLGCADAGRAAKIQCEKAVDDLKNNNNNNNNDSIYPNISAVNLMTFNGAAFGIDYGAALSNAIHELPNIDFTITSFTTHGDHVHKAGACYAGYIPDNKDKPANLNRRWIQFNFKEGLTQGDSFAEIYSNGSVEGVTKEGKRKANAHSLSYFKEHQLNTKKQNPVHVRYFYLDNDEDKKLIHASDMVGEVDKNEDVFTSNFSYSEYLDKKKKEQKNL